MTQMTYRDVADMIAKANYGPQTVALDNKRVVYTLPQPHKGYNVVSVGRWEFRNDKVVVHVMKTYEELMRELFE